QSPAGRHATPAVQPRTSSTREPARLTPRRVRPATMRLKTFLVSQPGRLRSKCSPAALKACTSGLAGHLEKRLVAAHVAQRPGLRLAALLGPLGGRARFAELGLERRAIERLRADRLLDEHERAGLAELQVALGLVHAHHVL